MKDFEKFKCKDLCILHLNICSLRKNLLEIDDILVSKIFDIVSLNETKLDNTIPNSFYSNVDYLAVRRDKTSKEGGLIIFIKKEYLISKNDIGITNEFKIDYIYIQLKIKKQYYNFINCYKPPHMNNIDFCNDLEDLIYSFKCNDPLIIIGDLNMDLLVKNNNQLEKFIKNNNLCNYVNEPTRNATVYHEKENITTTSSTLLDVVIHNNDLINNCNVIDCPFSDHRFVMVNLKVEKLKYQKKSIIGRMLTSENLLKISREFDFVDFSNYFLSQNVNEKWSILENDLLVLLNKIAPEKKIVIVHMWTIIFAQNVKKGQINVQFVGKHAEGIVVIWDFIPSNDTTATTSQEGNNNKNNAKISNYMLNIFGNQMMVKMYSKGQLRILAIGMSTTMVNLFAVMKCLMNM